MSLRRTGAIFLGAGALLLLTVFLMRGAAPLKSPAVPAATKALPAKGEAAIMGAEWGMTPDTVQKCIGRELIPATQDPVFYPLVSFENEGRAKLFEVSSVNFGTRSALLRLVFIDGKLSAYYFFLEDTDEESLDRDVLAELVNRFGEKHLTMEDGGHLRAIWPLKSLDVNYWLAPNELRLIPSYRAAVGAQYKGSE